MIKQKLQQEMIIAMKNKDNLRLSAIRLVISKIKEKEINSRDNNSVDFDDSQIISLMQSMIKQRQDSAIQYEKANRLDLANKEMEEIKVIRSFAEKLITRAKKNLDDIQPAEALHNKREVMRKMNDRTLVDKLFTEIAPRYKEVNGGYTRIYKLVNRPSDNSEMGILELVNKKSKEEMKEVKKLRKKH